MEVNKNLTTKAKRDYQIIRRALDEGDQHAYAELMNLYKDSLYFMMLKMTNDDIDAEDMTIEAFGRAFKSLKNYKPNFAFSTWLFKIASNNCIDFLRKKRKILLSINPDLSEEETTSIAQNIQSESPNPEEKIITKQKHKIMREVVNKLKPHYKTLVELRYFKEYSYEEISQEMNLPLGTVKAQLFRVRDFLYQIMKDSTQNI